VGSFPAGASPYGALDMAGNVFEWCQSLYRPYPYQADDGREDLKAEGYRVLRGGSWTDPEPYVRCACRYRSGPFQLINVTGFRVARGPLP
jgi:formylglycine-generating enzyme required for sulfatase activity